MSLDSLITRNRDRLSVGVASDDEVAALVVDATGGGFDGPSDGQVEGWHLIALRARGRDGPLVSLRCLGWAYGDTWITSDVVAVASDRSAVRTRSGSLYRLGERGRGEIHPRLVMLVGRSLHAWGLNDALDLNVFGRTER